MSLQTALPKGCRLQLSVFSLAILAISAVQTASAGKNLEKSVGSRFLG